MNRYIRTLFGTMSVLVVGVAAQATPIVLLDRSPDAVPLASITPLGTPSAGNWTNMRMEQHFADSFSFNATVSLTGMSLYSGHWWGAVGDTVSIQLFDDAGGVPGTLLSEFNTTIASIDTNGASRSDASELTQKYADFGFTMVLPANATFWIGMSGGTSTSPGDIAAAGLISADDGQSALLYADGGPSLVPVVGDMSMRLYGNPIVTPDGGATVVALLLSCLGIASIYRRRIA